MSSLKRERASESKWASKRDKLNENFVSCLEAGLLEDDAFTRMFNHKNNSLMLSFHRLILCLTLSDDAERSHTDYCKCNIYS